MQIDPGVIVNLPDLIAMPIMIGFLISLRERHPKLDTRSWLVGLCFLFLSQTSWLIRGSLETHLTLTIVLELLAGLAFASYRGDTASYRTFDLGYFACNSIVFIVVEILYGMGIRSAQTYIATILAGLVVLATSTLWRRHDVHRAYWGAAALLILLVPVLLGRFDAAADGLLAAVYIYAAFNFDQRLTPKSVGKIAILIGITLMSICFAAYPWVAQHGEFLALVEHVWKMQSFIVPGGMLLVLVENQSSRNQYLALHDQLTGIPNRRMLDITLKQEIEWAQKGTGRLTLVMIDLNGFKQINDTYGHLAGDHVLHEVARRLRGHLRTTDFVARMGGDEFVVVSRAAVGEESLKALEASLRKWIREPIDWDDKRLWIDGSMGPARFPEDVARWSDDVSRDTSERLAGAMLRIADMRMYAQKPSSKAGLGELETIFPASTLLN